MARQLAIVDVDQVSELGDGCPRLFGIPRPVMAPCLLGPQGTKEHADGHKGQSYADEIVGDVEPSFIVHGLFHILECMS